MKYTNNPVFNSEFQKIQEITYYPYVGRDYLKWDLRILVFAHNIPIKPPKFDSERLRMSSPTHFAEAIEEFTFTQKNYTRAFRNFIKGANGLNCNFTRRAPEEVLDTVDSFVHSISFTNYINGLVKSDRQLNVDIDKEILQKSHIINSQIINILSPTHIICWGKEVFDYVLKVSEKREKIKYFAKKGFAHTRVLKDNTEIKVLKIFHPSMPSFGHLQKNTHDIFKEFLKK